MKYIIEQQTVLFYRRILRGFNVAPQFTLSESRLCAVTVV